MTALLQIRGLRKGFGTREVGAVVLEEVEDGEANRISYLIVDRGIESLRDKPSEV